MTCFRCGKPADVAVHIENGDPLLYCDPCRAKARPDLVYVVTAELRLTRRSDR